MYVYGKILVPVDGSSGGNNALEHAASLANLCKAQVRVLHVLDVLAYANGFESSAIFADEVWPAMLASGHNILDEAQQKLQGFGVEVQGKLEQCDGRRVSQIIVDHAKEWGADLIVMGTHGRRGFNRLMMGSDAELVARIAPIPVLLVKPDRTDDGQTSN
jgi:nucleotide-binding universal stress UspA family protein